MAIRAGGGALPVEAARAARDAGNAVTLIALADEAELGGAVDEFPCERVGWGQVGRLFKLLEGLGADRLVIVGSVARRPDISDIQLDWGAIQLLPRLMSILFGGGDTVLLDRLAGLFADKGITLAGVHEVAPGLVAGAGHLGGPRPGKVMLKDAHKAAHAAWSAGHLDIGQAAVVVAGRIVALEGAEGTDGLLLRVGAMRDAGRFSARGRQGVLAKCPRPGQDLRLDMPAIGPRTIEGAAAAQLAGLVVEEGAVLVSSRVQTLDLCSRLGVTLMAEARSAFVPDGCEDKAP